MGELNIGAFGREGLGSRAGDSFVVPKANGSMKQRHRQNKDLGLKFWLPVIWVHSTSEGQIVFPGTWVGNVALAIAGAFAGRKPSYI